VRAISNVEQRLADHRRLVVQRPSPSLIGGPSNWLITLNETTQDLDGPNNVP